MNRLLLILALVCTGLTPGATCLYTVAAQSAVAQTHCEMVCCGPSCCCVGDDDPVSVPDAPATPPRGTDLAPTLVLSAEPFAVAWDDQPNHALLDAGYTSRECRRESRAVRPMICCWLT